MLGKRSLNSDVNCVIIDVAERKEADKYQATYEVPTLKALTLIKRITYPDEELRLIQLSNNNKKKNAEPGVLRVTKSKET